jgi:hypothetical protein
MLERCVFYDGLTETNVEILHDLARQSGMNTIKTINRRAAALKAAQTALPVRRESDKANHRMNFGVYFYHAIDDDSGEHQHTPPSSEPAKDN